MNIRNSLKTMSPTLVDSLYMKYCPVYLPWFSRKDKKIVKLKKVEIRKAYEFRYTHGKQIKLVIDSLLWPLITFIYSLLYACSKKGKYVKRTERIGIFRQVIQQMYIANRHNIHPVKYYSHRLFKKNNIKNLHYYFFHPLLSGLIEELNKNSDISILYNKKSFECHCNTHNIPTIPIYAVINSGTIFQQSKKVHSDAILPKQDLFIKPVDSLLFPYGSGAECWLYNDQYWFHNGKRFDETTFLEYLKEISKITEYIIMPRMKNHPSIIHLTNESLSTVRIVTILYDANTIKPIFSFLRMPVGNMEIDNISSGGMYAKIEPDGTIGKGMFFDITFGERSKHPNSGIQFEDEIYPMFSDILELCISAHKTMPQIRSIGWDIALTEDGITIVEGNNNWGEPASSHKPLGLTEFTDWALSLIE